MREKYWNDIQCNAMPCDVSGTGCLSYHRADQRRVQQSWEEEQDCVRWDVGVLVMMC